MHNLKLLRRSIKWRSLPGGMCGLWFEWGGTARQPAMSWTMSAAVCWDGWGMELAGARWECLHRSLLVRERG